METAIAILFIFLILSGMLRCYLYERKTWNHGICNDCKTAWVYFDMDSGGGRGYHCDCSDRHIVWVSYPGIDKKKLDKNSPAAIALNRRSTNRCSLAASEVLRRSILSKSSMTASGRALNQRHKP